MKRIVLAIGLLILLVAGALTYLLNDRPSLDHYQKHVLAPAPHEQGKLRATFFGVSTLLFDDGETALLVDGFFSRPGWLKLAVTRIEPDRDAIALALKRAGIDKLAAIVTVHSHYDHAMDVAVVAQATGARVVGSKSTANIALGGGLTPDRVDVIQGGERMTFGKLVVTLIPNEHFPHGFAMGDIKQPLEPPAHVTAYKEGGSYSLLIEHEGRSLLVHGSAGYKPDALRGRSADVAFVALAGLGRSDEADRDAYWREIVDQVGARRVIPIHWDDFTLPLDQPLEPLPNVLDRFSVTMKFLFERAKERDVEVRFAPAWKAIDPFAGLSATPSRL